MSRTLYKLSWNLRFMMVIVTGFLLLTSISLPFTVPLYFMYGIDVSLAATFVITLFLFVLMLALGETIEGLHVFLGVFFFIAWAIWFPVQFYSVFYQYYCLDQHVSTSGELVFSVSREYDDKRFNTMVNMLYRDGMVNVVCVYGDDGVKLRNKYMPINGAKITKTDMTMKGVCIRDLFDDHYLTHDSDTTREIRSWLTDNGFMKHNAELDNLVFEIKSKKDFKKFMEFVRNYELLEEL